MASSTTTTTTGQTQSKWKTAQSTGNVYTNWDTNAVVLDSDGKTQVLLNKRLKKEDGYEEQIGKNDKGEKLYYRVRQSDNAWLIYVENETKRAERLAKSAGRRGGKDDDNWRIKDHTIETDPNLFIYRITMEGWSPWGKDFASSTQVIDGKIHYGLVKRERVVYGQDAAAAGTGTAYNSNSSGAGSKSATVSNPPV